MNPKPTLNPLRVEGEEYLTKLELSQRLKVGVRTVDRWMREGKVPPHKFTLKVVRFKWVEVQRALEEKEQRKG
jgi:predicted site-specific integrase-resolvase